jgi:hypothetical protein
VTTTLLPGESLMDARRRLDAAGKTGERQLVGGVVQVPQGRVEVGLPDSPFLTLAEGARFARFDDCADPVRAFYKWLSREAVPVRRRGRKVLVERRTLEHHLSKGA